MDISWLVEIYFLFFRISKYVISRKHRKWNHIFIIMKVVCIFSANANLFLYFHCFTFFFKLMLILFYSSSNDSNQYKFFWTKTYLAKKKSNKVLKIDFNFNVRKISGVERNRWLFILSNNRYQMWLQSYLFADGIYSRHISNTQ